MRSLAARAESVRAPAIKRGVVHYQGRARMEMRELAWVLNVTTVSGLGNSA